MHNQKHYTIEEDICLGEALMHCGLSFTNPGFSNLHQGIEDVHEVFVKKTAKFGIDGHQRTQRSLIDRVKVLRRHIQNGQLRFGATKQNCLKRLRYHLFSKIFKGDGSPTMCHPILHKQSSAQRKARLGEEGGGQGVPKNEEEVETILDWGAAVSQEPEGRVHEGRIRKERHINARRLLRTMSNIHRERTEMLMKREENERKEQRVLQNERRWKRDVVKRILKRSHGDDNVCSEFLKTMEEISVNDIRLRMMREDRVRERIENEMENCEWERSTFEELVKLHFD